MSLPATSAVENPAVGAARPHPMAPIVIAGCVGTIIEWYDFLIYGTAAALVFNKQFFPDLDPLTGTLAALATYAVGFFARPLGGALFGHIGDRRGRKVTLQMTLVVMGLATFLIGLLPSYAAIGIWAPVLLVALRIVQGLGLGGEWGGASLMVLEHAPSQRRGFYGSLVQVGFPLGLVLASGAFALASQLPDADFKSWGWRLPFLASIVLFGLGWFVRARLPETPVFEELKARGATARSPFYEAIFKDTRSFLVSVGLKISEVSWVYILTVFVVGYATRELGVQRSLLLQAITIAALVEVITIPVFGWLSDIVGRRIFYVIGALFTIGFAFPLFWLLASKDAAVVTGCIIVALSLGHGTMFGLQSAYFPELFGARARFTGASFGFQVAAALGGGLAPILAAWLAAVTGRTAGVSIMLIGLALITLVAVAFARETNQRPLRA